MNAKELIQELQQVHPDTEITVTTERGGVGIERVERMGYTDKVFTIIPQE